MNNTMTAVRAGAGRRIAAALIDIVMGVLLWLACTLVLTPILATGFTDTGDAAALALVLGLPVSAIIYGIFYGTRRTLGAAMVGIKSVRVPDGRPLGAWKGIGRMLATVLLVPFIPLLIIGAILSATTPFPTFGDGQRKYTVIRTRS